MKDILKALLVNMTILTLWSIAMYVSFVFVLLERDPLVWSKDARAFFLLMGPLLGGFIANYLRTSSSIQIIRSSKPDEE